MYSTTTTPAFHTVQANRTFARPTASQPLGLTSTPPQANGASTSASEKSRKVDWPLPVRKYVQRAFMPEHNISGIGRAEMEEKLKETITQANERGALHTINWESLPLPQQMIQAERFTSGGSLVGKLLNETTTWPSHGHGSHGPVPTDGSLSTKKRKSSDLHATNGVANSSRLPWRQTNNRNDLEDRVASLSPSLQLGLSIQRPGLSDSVAGKDTGKSSTNLAKRQRRFDNGDARNVFANRAQENPRNHNDVEKGPIVGRSQAMEKKYFRLTAPPNPDTVRPLPILRMTLEFLKKKWKLESNYSYICDQFKSLRQDLTVQHIKNEFTIHVYEIHARIALEKGDLGEYNQCQTQLRALYSQNLGGNPMEFKAYRVLYFIHTCSRTDMNSVLADLTPAEKNHPAVKHALEVRSALALGNYHKFFRLYLDTPNMGAYLMDMFVERERLAALANICKAYKPDVRLRFITEELGFESDQDSLQFLCAHDGQDFLEERDDSYRLLTSKAGPVFETAKNKAFGRVDIKGQL